MPSIKFGLEILWHHLIAPVAAVNVPSPWTPEGGVHQRRNRRFTIALIIKIDPDYARELKTGEIVDFNRWTGYEKVSRRPRKNLR